MTYNADGTISKLPFWNPKGVDQIGTLNPYVQTEAETIAWSEGLKTETCGEGGMMVTEIQNGDYIKVKGVDFGGGATSLDVRVASAGSGGNIEVRLESKTGTLVGTCAVAGTGGAQTWATKTCPISGASGVHDLFFVFTGSGTGSLFNFNWWKFSGTPSDGGAAGGGGSDAGASIGGTGGEGGAGGSSGTGGTGGSSDSSTGTGGRGGSSGTAGATSGNSSTGGTGGASTATTGKGGTGGSSTASSGAAGNSGTGGSTGSSDLPGDVAKAAGTPFVAAHSMTRALFSAYKGIPAGTECTSTGENPVAPVLHDIVTVVFKHDGTKHWGLKTANAKTGALSVSIDLPTMPKGYSPLKQEGGLGLGEGGAGDSGGSGGFSEGAVIAGETSDETDNAIQKSVVSVYGK